MSPLGTRWQLAEFAGRTGPRRARVEPCVPAPRLAGGMRRGGGTRPRRRRAARRRPRRTARPDGRRRLPRPATVAASGTYCTPLPVLAVTDASGSPVPGVGPDCHQAVDPDLAAAAADAARCPVGQQSAFGMCDGGTAPQVSDTMGGRPVAGKTGSAEDNATETFVGFTPQLVAAGIAADPDDPKDRVGTGVAPRRRHGGGPDARRRPARAALPGLPAAEPGARVRRRRSSVVRASPCGGTAGPARDRSPPSGRSRRGSRSTSSARACG